MQYAKVYPRTRKHMIIVPKWMGDSIHPSSGEEKALKFQLT
jgi:hypothetical protein